MRKLVYFVAATLDGFITDAPEADPSGTVFELDGDHAAPIAAEYPEMIPYHVRPFLGMGDVQPRHFDTVLEGRRSYQIGLDQDVPNAYPHLRHLVFSTTLKAAADPTIEVVSGDALGRVRELKAEESELDIWLCGGGSLAAALRPEIDEIHLKLNPVVLGRGVPLFGTPDEGATVIDRFRLTSSRTFDSGVALMIYERR